MQIPAAEIKASLEGYPEPEETFLVWGFDGERFGLFPHPDQAAAKIAHEKHLQEFFKRPWKKMGRTTYFFDKSGLCTGHD